MTKHEQKAINDKAYSIFNSAIEEWHKDGGSKRLKLNHCQAEVIWTIHYEIWGISRSSTRHIVTFARQYFGDCNYSSIKKLVARPVK